jgi:hypothetical protein
LNLELDDDEEEEVDDSSDQGKVEVLKELYGVRPIRNARVLPYR